jgi:hypothetical protein
LNRVSTPWAIRPRSPDAKEGNRESGAPTAARGSVGPAVPVLLSRAAPPPHLSNEREPTTAPARCPAPRESRPSRLPQKGPSGSSRKLTAHDFSIMGRTFENNSRRRPTLPHTCARSTIGAGGLNCRVRNGNGCFPPATVTGKLENCKERVEAQGATESGWKRWDSP